MSIDDAVASEATWPAGTAARVVTVDPTSDPLWLQLVTSRRSDVFHSPGWLQSLRDAYDLPVMANVLLDEHEVPVAGFVYCPIDDIMDPRVVSLPFSDFCDPLASTESEWDRVTEGVIDGVRRVHTKCLHSDLPLRDTRLRQAGRSRWHAIDLNRSAEEIWEGISSSARRSIRKARSQGIDVRVGDDLADLRAFFDLHLRVRKYKYGMLAQPWRLFESIWEHLLATGHGVLLLAVQEERILGGVLFLEWQQTLYYKFNASDPEHLGVRPNDLVIWTAIEHGLSRGLDRLDFGLSDWDQEGLLRFKRKYATEEKTIHGLETFPPVGPSDREAEIRRVLPSLTTLLTAPEVPDAITEAAGDVLYKYFT